jgi:hypothetical protein
MAIKSKIPENITNTQLLRSMARRRKISLKTISQEHNNQSKPVKNIAASHSGKMSDTHASQSEAIHNKPHDVNVLDPDKPSIDLKKQPKGIIRWIKYLPGRIRRYYRIMRPLPTEEELENREARRIEKSRDKLCIREGNKYGRLASDKLAQLGMRELLNSPDPNKPKKLKKVRWSMMTRDALFNKIVLRMDTNPRHLPTYVRVSELGRNPIYSDEMLPTLGKYSQWSSEEYGVSLTVFRHGLEGLPEYVTTNDLWKKCPDNKPPYTIAVGFGDNSSTHFIDPSQYPHLLISGGTGWGKSNLVNQIICFWLSRGLNPEDLQLVLFDLKRGLEFDSYRNLPHLYHDDVIQSGIIEDLDGVLPALHRLQEIRDKRMDLIKKAKYKNFQDYNLGVGSKQRIPAIFLVFDEWAKIRLSRSGVGPKALIANMMELANDTVKNILYSGSGSDRIKLSKTLEDFGKGVLKLRSSKHFGLEAEELLAEFTNLSRAAGMFVILSTQHPSKEVLTGLIMINFPTRIVLNSSVGGSMAALGTQSAFGLEYKGRAILLDRGQETKLQTPHISDSLIKSIVHKAITGEDKIYRAGIDLEEILEYSLKHHNGDLSIQKLYSEFRDKRVRRDWLLKALKDGDDKEFILSGSTYKIAKPSGTISRKLVKIK